MSKIQYAPCRFATTFMTLATLFILSLSVHSEPGWYWEKHDVTTPVKQPWKALACSSNGGNIVAGRFEGYVCTSPDAGKNWTTRVPGGNWSCMASSGDGNVVLGGMFPGPLYLSTNSGVDWSAVSPEGSNQYWNGVACSRDGQRLFVGQYRGYLYLSSDTGATWTQHDPTGGAQNVIWSFTASSGDGMTLAAGVYDGKVYTSTTGGGTWAAREPVAGNHNWRCGTVSGDGRLILVAEEDGYIYASSDGGATWSELKPTTEAKAWSSIACSNDGATVVASADDNSTLFISRDGGATWGTLVPKDGATAGWGGVCVSSGASTIVAAMNDGNIYVSTDSGESWDLCETGNYWATVAASSDCGKLLAGGESTALYLSGDSGETWSVVDSLGSRDWSCAASSSDGNLLYAGVEGGAVYASSNSGVTWNALTGVGEELWMALACSSDGGKVLVGAGGLAPGPLFVSNDSGATWTNPFAFEAYWSDVSSSSDGAIMVAAASGDYVYISKDSGVTWAQSAPSGAVGTWTGVAVSGDGTKLAVSEYNGYIYTSEDLGTTWTKRDPAGEAKEWRKIRSSSDGSHLAVSATSGGIWISSDSGATWTESLPGGTAKLWNGMASASDGTKLVAGVYGGGVYTGRFYENPGVLTISVFPDNNAGTTDPDPGEHAIDRGATIALVATPASGYQFVGWTGSAVAEIADPSSANTTLTLNGDKAWVVANFALDIIEIRSFTAQLDSSNQTRNKVDIKKAELPELPDWFDPITSPNSSTVIVYFDNTKYVCGNGEWKRSGREGSYKYTFKTNKQKAASPVKLILDTNKDTWDFQIKSAQYTSLNSSNGIVVILQIGDDCYGGLYYADDSTSWKYNMPYNRIPDTFAVSKLTAKYNNAKENTDSLKITKAFTGTSVAEFGDVTIKVNRFELTIAADKFSSKRAGLYVYNSQKDPDYDAEEKIDLKIDLNKYLWTLNVGKSSLSDLIGEVGYMDVSMKIGEYESQTRELLVDQSTRIKYKKQ